MSTATGVLIESLESDAAFTTAILADITGVLFWLAVIASIAAGLWWLCSLMEHLEIRKGWRRALAFAGLLVFTKILDLVGTYLRSISPSYEPGEATFGAAWFLLSCFFLFGPLALILGSRGDKKC